MYKYPAVEHADLPFPNEVAFFGLPMGAVIESWPTSNPLTSTYLNDLDPIFNTFVLNVNSDDGVIMEKVYGACLIFYERFDAKNLSPHQLSLLLAASNRTSRQQKNDDKGAGSGGDQDDRSHLNLHSNKCLLILSRTPLFDTYRSFLLFLLRKYTVKYNVSSSFLSAPNLSFLPIERYYCILWQIKPILILF